MKKEQNKDNAITKTDLVFIVGLALFAYPTWMGLKFVHNDDVLSVLISILHIALLCMFVYGLKKIKTVETNFKTWKWVEIFLLLVFIVSLLLFINVPMNRTFEVFSQSKDLKKQAEKELIEIEQKIKEFKDKEEKAITEVCNALDNAVNYSTDSVNYSTEYYEFDEKSKNYVNHFVIKSDNGGKITKEKIDDYKKLLTNKLNDIIKEEIVPYEIKCKEMKERNGWNVINLYEISDYSEELDTLYKIVETELTNFSKLRHSETKYPYKFILKKSDNSFIIDEVLEYNYDIKNDDVRNENQSYFKTMFDNIIDENDFKNNFNIISLVIIIMILFPYLMANRSTIVLIKRMYDKNNKDLGGQDL